ncbi:MAG TPA: LAGLIDADG family homing endonuclease, partial [Rhabdochlamydiaceae bacterium]|nr:LAGLIDADG family homing endonuclease [Rhabdochlamydiaceae bacterium]
QKNWFHVYLPSPTPVTHGKYHPITTWFSNLGIERVRSYDKKIPPLVFENSEEKIALFLRHLWATDGNISVKKNKGRQNAGAIYYSSSSQQLADQTQHLLCRLGVQSTLSVVPSKKGYRNMYHLNVFGASNQKLFLTKVGCAGKRGRLIPQLLEQLQNIKPNPNNDIIPKEAWQSVIRQAKDQFQFHNLANSDVYWDEITSIEELGIEDVYDATVENVHNFVANDIIVHNSIEQDSDIVMFLLRREYYDPYDKPGLAELIVAKNRHGGVGNINLTFRKELAQFANYSPLHTAGSSAEEDNTEAFSAFSPK